MRLLLDSGLIKKAVDDVEKIVELLWSAMAAKTNRGSRMATLIALATSDSKYTSALGLRRIYSKIRGTGPHFSVRAFILDTSFPKTKLRTRFRLLCDNNKQDLRNILDLFNRRKIHRVQINITSLCPLLPTGFGRRSRLQDMNIGNIVPESDDGMQNVSVGVGERPDSSVTE